MEIRFERIADMTQTELISITEINGRHFRPEALQRRRPTEIFHFRIEGAEEISNGSVSAEFSCPFLRILPRFLQHLLLSIQRFFQEERGGARWGGGRGVGGKGRGSSR